jgi:hypothetical protein
MNFQYYENLWDKSEKNLFSLVENIVPAPKEEELVLFLDSKNITSLKKKKKSSFHPDYIEITDIENNEGDLSQLNSDALQEMYQTFISKEKNDKKAVKWRFFNFLRFQKTLKINTIHIKTTTEKEDPVDLIVETPAKEIILINCSYILEKEYYKSLIDDIIDFSKKIDTKPDKIIFSAHKTYRDIPYQEKIKIGSIEYKIEKEIWVEWTELDKPFNGEDLLLVLSNNKKDLEVAGFNFTNIKDLLDYVYNYSRGGQISIFKQAGFFSKKSQDNTQIEPIWKGIMLKNKI